MGGCGGQRTLANLLVSSLLRTGWTGDILLFHNGKSVGFLTPRARLEEVALELAEESCLFFHFMEV